MNKKQSKRQRDIKTKLIAAICMLLVSSIMMVSTTYAWFTLSTAPEVTGINTAVGANGNLEMALMPLDGDVTKITSGTADSMAVTPAKVSNVTWGNLVKLDGTGENGYGLDQIVLYPSALNAQTVSVENGTVDQIKDIALKTPKYGADGRVSTLAENTLTGVYQNGGFFQSATQDQAVIDKPYGVRGIGTISGLSPRELAYRLAKSNANTAALQAKSTASTTLNNNGSKLADIAIARALNNADSFEQADVDAMTNVLNDLLNGTLVHIETALKNYIVAATIAPAAADANYEAIVTAITAATLDDLADGKITGADNAEITVILPGDMATWIAKLNTMKTNVQNARDGLPTGGGPYTWEQIRTPMEKLIDSSKLNVNGKTVSQVKDNPGSILNDVLANGLVVTMTSGAGVFADVADFAGNYTAEITISKLQYGTMVFDDPIKAKMNTATGENPVFLTAAANGVADFADAGGNGGANPITDFYGFIIDLAFRTNAANSWLQIQPTAVDRIYEDGTNVNTMGHGATMTFGVTDSVNFPGESVKNLMGAIRIVFFDPSAQNEIICYGRLNAAAVDTSVADQITMPIMLCDKDGNPKTDDTSSDRNESVGIMELAQNQAQQLSVLVYLDGSVVGNDDVPVTANLTGSMNLQFSSSATLVAMQYADLKAGEGGALDGSGSTTETTGPAVTVADVTTGTVTGATSATVKHITAGNIKALVATIDGVDQNYNGTVSIGGQTATWQTVGTLSGWAVTGVDVPAGAVDITVTPATGG